MKRVAVRNVRLCTKDCLCLYVCPTGASDTENSIIDVTKCIGCGNCADACPSGAISLVPVEYPPQQQKTEKVQQVLFALTQSKMDGAKIASQVADISTMDGLTRLMKAVARSEQIMAEDVIREAGFMLPQSDNTHKVLKQMIANPPTDAFPAEVAEKLLALIPNNEVKETAKWKCSVCGHVHEGEQPPEQCPLCKQPAEKFERV